MKKIILPSLRVLYSSRSNPRYYGNTQTIPESQYRRLLQFGVPKFAMTIIMLYLFSCSSTNVLAVSTATPSATISPSQTQDIQEKIKTLVKENLSATESILKERINQQTLVGFVGPIQSINSGNVTINIKDGTILQITTNEKTTITKNGSSIKLTSLAISDKVIVIGTLLKEDIVMAKRIVVIPDEANPVVSDTIVAKVSSVDLKKKLIGLTVNDQEVMYSLTKKSTIKIVDLKVGMTIFAITKKYEGKDLLSRAKIL